ncbi:hypothetical protein MRB53_040469 [Persea americana]|nr:hypothetical protein MRB53_040469 [Persea americana]
MSFARLAPGRNARVRSRARDERHSGEDTRKLVLAQSARSLTSRQAAKKPIYDDPTPPAAPPSSRPAKDATRDRESSPSASPTPTATDRLAVHIRAARLQIHDWTVQAEDGLNSFMSRALKAESNVAHTVASLAPPKGSDEQLMPGLVYVLVATLAGSIISRNRGILLRAATPLLFGVAAGQVVIPITMRNVGDLAWEYEKKYPQLAQTHLKIRDQAQYIWETGKAHTGMTIARGEAFVDETREKMQEWVKQGK